MTRMTWLALATTAAATVACTWGSSQECRATLEADGRTWAPLTERWHPSEDQALHAVCLRYCIDTDEDCERIYQFWLSTPEGEAAGRPPKADALYAHAPLFECLTEDCTSRCADEFAAGTLGGSMECREAE